MCEEDIWPNGKYTFLDDWPEVGGCVEGGPPGIHHVQWQVQDGALSSADQQVLAGDTLLRHRVSAQQ